MPVCYHMRRIVSFKVTVNRQEIKITSVLGYLFNGCKIQLIYMKWHESNQLKSLLLERLHSPSITVRNSDFCLVNLDHSCDKDSLSVSPSSSINSLMFWLLKRNLEYRRASPLKRLPITIASKKSNRL